MFAITDIETTGGNYKTGKITEVAIYIFDGEKIVDSLVTLVNPECAIPWYITRITGITDEMVMNAPKFYEIARQIVELTANKIFVAHNVNFDYNFIKQEFKELGYNYNRKKICTVEMSRKYLPGFKSYSLGKICANLGIAINERHRAVGDALATVELFSLLLKKHHALNKSLF